MGVIAFVASIPVAASAHYVYVEKGNLWQGAIDPDFLNADICLKDWWTEISHGNYSRGYSKQEAQYMTGFDTPYGHVKCGGPTNLPLHSIRVRSTLWKWVHPGDFWAICKTLAWKYSGDDTPNVTQQKHWTQDDFCAPGWYGTVGEGEVWLPYGSGGHYRTQQPNGFFSGCHWLPPVSGDSETCKRDAGP